MVKTSVTHSAIASCATFLLLPHFDVICDLLLNRRTAPWNLFVKYRLVLAKADYRAARPNPILHQAIFREICIKIMLAANAQNAFQLSVEKLKVTVITQANHKRQTRCTGPIKAPSKLWCCSGG